MAGIVTSAMPANASAERTGSTSALTMSPGTSSASAIRAMEEPMTRGHLDRRLGIGGAERLQALEDPDRFEIEVGEGAVVVVDPGEAEGAPEALQHVDADTGELGHLDPGVAAARRDQQAVRHEEVDHAVGHGMVDLLLGGPVHEEDLFDVLQRRLPARLVIVVGQHVVAVEDAAHVGSPRSSDSSHSGREGRRMRLRSASAGEQRPSTMAWTCSAMGISTPWARANPTNGPALLMPSATMCMPPTMSSSDCPCPSANPTVRFRLCGLAQVATRSPTPARPPNVSTFPPRATPSRPNSARPRGDEDGPGVVPESQPVADPGGDGHHVLGGAGDLAPHDIGAHIGTEGARVHQRLHAAGQRLVRQGHHAGGRMPLRHLAGQVRSGEDAGGNAGEDLGHDLRHAQVGPHLNPLGQAHDGFDVPGQRLHVGQHGAEPVRRHRHEDDADTLERLGQRRCHRQPVREAARLGGTSRSGASRAMDAASSGERTQREAGCEAPMMVPTAVPHDPAPITATRSLMAPEPTADPQRTSRGPLHCPRCRGPAVPPAEHAADAADLVLGPRGRPDPGQGLPPGQAEARGRPCPIRIASHSCAPWRRTWRRACVPLPIAVVCDDEDVARWAADVGATVMWEPGQGLNGAVRAGVDRLARAGTRWVTVAHGDLPRAHRLGVLAPFDGITLVPDRRDDGTNVLRLPAGSDFCFAYGARLLSRPPGGSHEARAPSARAAGPGFGL